MNNQILLSTKNSKTVKGEKLGYKTYIMYLAPYKQNSLGRNLCSHASIGCAQACLYNSGNGRFNHVQEGRMRKTEFWLSDRQEFLMRLKAEIEKAVRLCEGKFIPVFRLNGTSDLPFEKFKFYNGKNIFELFPEVTFYDYTKNYIRIEKDLPSNYHLTFSRSETNEAKAIELLNKGYNVSVVFKKLPELFKGFEVINGDIDDLRFLDKKNVVVGLTYKTMTGKGVDNSLSFKSGFVII